MESTSGMMPLNAPRHEDHPISRKIQVETKRHDPLNRFTPTPHGAALPVMGRTIRLETNDEGVLEHAVELFAPYPGSPSGRTHFLWRILVQPRPQMSPPWPKRSAFSGPGLRFVQFGQSNFLAVDLEAREGIGYIAEGLAEDELGLTSPFLDNLFCMTAGSLGLVSLRANCVAHGQEGLLVFGDPNSGKTTASYLAAKLGLRFHADEGVFVEVKANRLLAWGGFWPVAFRPEALRFLPELQGCARPLSYRDFTFYHLDKHRFQPIQASPVVPVCCVFLQRERTASPGISPIAPIELSRRLAENVLFEDDDRFMRQQATVFSALERLPAYHVAYGSDPAIAASFVRQALMNHDFPEVSTPVETRARNGRLGSLPDAKPDTNRCSQSRTLGNGRDRKPKK